jgi:hypothetical protein
MPEPVTLDLPLPPAPGGSRRTYRLLRNEWRNRCDMATLAQVCGAPRVDGPYALGITMRSNGKNGAALTSYVNDLLAYLRERELVHSSGPAHLRKLILAWGDASEAPEGVRLELRELSAAA